jgi:hypothetical protein
MYRFLEKSTHYQIEGTTLNYIDNPANQADKLFNIRDVEQAIGATCVMGCAALNIGGMGEAVRYEFAHTEHSFDVYSVGEYRYATIHKYPDDAIEDDEEYWERYANLAMLAAMAAGKGMDGPFKLTATQSRRLVAWVAAQTPQQEAA